MVWVELESTVIRQTLCAQHHDETSETTDAHHEKTQPWDISCGVALRHGTYLSMRYPARGGSVWYRAERVCGRVFT